MPKRLTITYDGLPVWDGDVDEYHFSDTGNGVAVSGKVNPPRPAGGAGGGLKDLVAAMSKRQTQAVAEQKRRDYEAEAEVEAVAVVDE